MTKLNLGIVGCGDIAGFTALVSRLVSQVRLSACCDRDFQRARAFARRHRIGQVYGDFAKMLVEADMEAVYLAVPHHLHYEMIVAAAASGKAVLVEKPLTRTLEEGLGLLETVGEQKIGVNYQYRYDRGCYALARAVQAGRLGRVSSVRINVPWRRSAAYFDQAAWHRTIAQAGGGTLITQGSHFLDIALWALDQRPVSAMGYTASPGFEVEVDTVAQGIVETGDGALINITSSMVAAQERGATVEIYGERGTAIYRDGLLPRVKFTGVRVRKEGPPEWGIHALQRSLAGFAHWVLHDKLYLTPAHEALPVLAAVDAIYRSARSGNREKITL